MERGKRDDDARRGGRSAPQSRSFEGRGPYSEEHERVFQALRRLQREHRGEAVHLEEVASASRLPPEETSGLLHDLVTVHGLATELAGSDTPDLGPRFELRPHL
ncbi:hypothetical protein ACIRPQ_14100 [Streptomyces sp. NPDC101213]|uniref:hypothetical protein n=1 Tax=unclassified Streptomyces TaxID=2593676 RepID=UPI0036FD12AE